LPSLQQLSTKRHELSQFILEDILDCPINSHFIVCIAANGANLKHGDICTEKDSTIADKLKRAGLEIKLWRMTGQKYIVIQGKLDQ
jgi:hypothetical protein